MPQTKMNAVHATKKMARIAAWSIGIIIAILVLLSALTQIPFVQRFIILKATSFATQKTNAYVSIAGMGIAFPSSVYINGLCVQGPLHDTLVCAGKVFVTVDLRGLITGKIHISSLRLTDAIGVISRTNADSLYNFQFLIAALADTLPKKPKTQAGLALRIDNIDLKDIRFKFDDHFAGIIVDANLHKLHVNVKKMDLPKLQFNLHTAAIDGLVGKVTLNKKQKTMSPEPAPPDLQISAKNFELSNCSFAYEDSTLLKDPQKKDTAGFDAARIRFTGIGVSARSAFYSPALIRATVKNISARDSNRFYLSNLSTDFEMSDHRISATNLTVRTQLSTIKCSSEIKFPTLASIADSLGKMYVSAKIIKASIGVKDILYFIPQLASQPIFHGPISTITAAGTITGLLGDLKADKIELTLGNKTSLLTDCTLRGLPDANNLSFSVPRFKLTTGRTDLINLFGKQIFTDAISLPQQIELNAHGNGSVREFKASCALTTSYGSLFAQGEMAPGNIYNCSLTVMNFNVGQLLKDTALFGPITMAARIQGKGVDKDSIRAQLAVSVSSVYFNRYLYHSLYVDGVIASMSYDGKISLNDSNATLNFDGLVDLRPKKEHYDFLLDIKNIDLKRTHIMQEDIQVSAKTVVDARGKDIASITGSALLTDGIVVKKGIEYRLDSVLCTSRYAQGISSINLHSNIIDIQYNGTIPPTAIAGEMQTLLAQYLPSQTKVLKPTAQSEQRTFSFGIQIHKDPILSGVFVPQLTGYAPCWLSGSFDLESHRLQVQGAFPEINYSGISIADANVNINLDGNKGDFELTSRHISNGSLVLNNVSANGHVQGQAASLSLSAIDDTGFRRIVANVRGEQRDSTYRISLAAPTMVLANHEWSISPNNFVDIGTNGVAINDLILHSASGTIEVGSLHDANVNGFNIKIDGLDMNTVSRIIVADTTLIAGRLNAHAQLTKINTGYGLNADVSLQEVAIKKINIGTLSIKAVSSLTGAISMDAKLIGAENNITATGIFTPQTTDTKLNARVDIHSVSMKTIEALSMGTFTQGSGLIRGSFTIQGDSKKPSLNGSLSFVDVFLNPAGINSTLHLQNETIEVKHTGIYFNQLTVRDSNNQTMHCSGSITTKQLTDLVYDLKIIADDFLVLNTSQKDNDMLFGTMILKGKLNISGSNTEPVIESQLKLRNGSHMTFAIPKNFVTADKGEGVVLFIDSLDSTALHGPQTDLKKPTNQTTKLSISADVEIDEKATLRLLVDQTSNDSLDIRGVGKLHFSMNPGGSANLSGLYTISDGNYLVSFQSVIKRKFKIEHGGTIIFNGDPAAGEIDIKAVCEIITSPIDLVANQISGIDEANKNAYRQRLTFLVILRLKGALLKPVISYELQLLPEDKGVLGGSVNAKLMQLNADPSLLDKQVFSLLVLGRFMQENPLESSNESSALSSVARGSVSALLTGQLNQWGARLIPGIELDMGVQSYDDFTSGKASGRTQVEIGVRKQLFNDRLSIRGGGAIDVEGARAEKNSASSIIGDVIVEYKLTDDGPFRLKGFRKNVYADPLEGQLVETGIGISFTRIFDWWKELFVRPIKADKKKNEH